MKRSVLVMTSAKQVFGIFIIFMLVAGGREGSEEGMELRCLIDSHSLSTHYMEILSGFAATYLQLCC